MAISKTPNLGLLVDSNLTANAKSNLYKIDDLAATIKQDVTATTVIRSTANISLRPEDSSIGGTGTGGSIFLGDTDQHLTSLVAYTDLLNITSPLGTLDISGSKYLRLTYNSTLSGAADTAADRTLALDLEGANRNLILGTSLSFTDNTWTTSSYTYTFPAISGTIVDLDSSQTLTGKSLSGSANTFTNIPYSALILTGSIINSDVSSSAAISYSKLNLSNSIINSDISASAAIVYSKLNLTSSIVNADVANAAAIAGTKISPDFGSSNIRTTGYVEIAKSASIATKLVANSGQASDITLILPSAAPATGALLRYDGASLEWSTLAGSGTVQSVATSLSAEADAILDISGTPITTVGTIAFDLATQVANTVFVGPSTGPDAKPTFRNLVDGDIPTITTSKLSDWSTAWDSRLATKSTSDLAEGTNLYYTSSRFNTDFSTKSTTDLTEGTNLYYTAARFNTAFSAKSTTDLTEGTNLYYTTARANTDFDARLATKSTTDLAEGTNLYYTAARFNTAFSAKSTSDLTEGTNLYYTTARANTDFDTRLATKSTTNLAEGTNLYYTDVRADARISLQKGAANGLATLDSGGKIPVAQLPNSVMEYKGTWNASTNSPSLLDGSGNAGDVYMVTVAGTQNLGSGSISFAVGDWVVYDGAVWQKSINSNAVVSVNGYTGVVSLTTSDISEGSNLYYTNARVDTQLATYKYVTTWVTGDGTSKAVSHSLGTTDVTWNIYDIDSGEEIWPDTAIRNTINNITFTSSTAPAGSGWKIVIRK